MTSKASWYCGGLPKTWSLLAPLVGLPLIFALMISDSQGAVESDIGDRVRKELINKDIYWAEVELNDRGRDVMLSGAAPSAESRDQAIKLAQSVEGVRVVEEQIEIQPARSPELSIKTQDGKITLSGLVPNREAAGSLLKAANNRVGASNVINNLSIKANTEEASWLKQAIQLVNGLSDHNSEISIASDKVTVNGTVNAYQKHLSLIGRTQTALAGSELTIQDNVLIKLPKQPEAKYATFTPPPAKPSSEIAASLSEGKLTLTGALANQAEVDSLLWAANSRVGAENVINQIQVNDQQTPTSWLPNAKKLVLSLLENDGKMSMNDDHALFSGMTENNKDYIAAIGKARFSMQGLNMAFENNVELNNSKLKQDKLAAEKAEQDKLAAEKAEQDKLAAEKAEQDKLAAEKTEQDKLAAEKAEQDKLAAEKAEQDKLAAEKAEQDKLAAEKAEQDKLAAEKAEQDKLAAEKAEQDKLAAEKAEQDKLAAEKAEQDKLAAEKAEQDKLAAEKAEQDKLAAEKAEQDKLAAEKAEQDKLAAEKAEQDKLAAEKAEQDKLAAEKAEQDKLAAEKAEQDKLAAEKAEQDKLAAEKAEQDKLAAEKAEQDKLAAEKAEQDKLAAEKAEQDKLAAEKAEQDKLAAEKAEQDKLAAEKAEQDKLAAEKAEQDKLAAEKAEQDKLAAEKAEQDKLAAEKAEQDKLAAEKLAAEKAEQERIAAEKLAAEKAEQERIAAEKLAAEKAEQERIAAEKLAAEKAEQERIAAEKLAAEKAEQERIAAEKLAAEKAEQERIAAEKLAAEKLARAKAEQQACQTQLNQTMLGKTILFASNKADIKPESFELLYELATVINDCEDILTNKVIHIGGHTDSRGEDAYNMELSLRRASAVLAYLKNSGIEPALLKAEGHGEEKPVADNGTAEGRAQNRRITFKIGGK